MIAHTLTAAGDALTLVAAAVMSAGLVYVGMLVASLVFVGAYVGVRLGVMR